MSTNITPEERERIAEEQRIRNNELVKTGFKTMGKVWLILGAVMLGLVVCLCIALTVAGGILSSLTSGLR